MMTERVKLLDRQRPSRRGLNQSCRGRSAISPLRRFWFYGILFLLPLSIAYVVLEIATRYLSLPERDLIEHMDTMVASVEDISALSSSASTKPLYGWDNQSDAILPPANSPDQTQPRLTVLFVGDSVTRGMGVEPEETYSALLYETLSGDQELRVVNAAVDAFGVDQMILKLEEILSLYQPDIVVFAYIPHDLWRSGRKVNFGLTKPVLIDFESSRWRMLPKPEMADFYQEYANSNARYYRGPWYMRHLYRNMRYYFPGFHSKYYRTLFGAIRDRLIALSELHNTNVFVVRLASSWPGAAIVELDRMGTVAFGEPTEMPNYTFLDTGECVKELASSSGIDFNSAFRWHPDKTGHRIYAECLTEPMRNALAVRSSARHSGQERPKRTEPR